MENDLKWKFTGKAIVLIEIDEYGPIEFRIDDLNTVMQISKILLDASSNTMTVNSYNKREENKMRNLLNF
jgi:hypothetical protein